jgi:hypothetical protein
VLISTATLPEYFYSLQNWDAPDLLSLSSHEKKSLDELRQTYLVRIQVRGLTKTEKSVD